MSEDEAFLAAIRSHPADETTRLAYADWLEERRDPRSAYLRADVERFHTDRTGWDDIRDSPVWSLRDQVDRVWAAMVSRAPLGILVPGLTFSTTGPKISPSDLSTIEERWQVELPSDYAAFLLTHNGGRPSKPYLYSYANYPEGIEESYDEVRLFSTVDRHPGGSPYLLLSVSEAYQGHVSEDADEERLGRLMPIGSVSRDDGCEAMLALAMGNDEEFPQVTVVTYWQHAGVSEDDDLHATDSFVGLLMELRVRATP